MLADGRDPSTIRNMLMPLRAIFRRAIARGEVAVNPVSGLELAAVRGRRDRIASPEEARKLLEALPKADRALWATAMYAGLRRGELMGSALGRRRLGVGPPPRRARLRSDRRQGDRAEVPRRPAPSLSPSRCATTSRQHKVDCAWTEARVRPLEQASPSATRRSQSTHRGCGKRPSSSRSACTNAATPSPR